MSRPELLRELLGWLSREGVPYEHVEHAAAGSTEDLARLRGRPVADGLKSLLVKAGTAWTLVALRADRALDNRALRRALGVRRLRFATREELRELAGLAPGEVPPFGPPLLPFPLVADAGALDRPEVAFTVGTTTDSVVVAAEDWRRLARPRLLRFAR